MSVTMELLVLSKSEISLGARLEISKYIEDIENFDPNNKDKIEEYPKIYSFEIGLIFLILKIKWGH